MKNITLEMIYSLIVTTALFITLSIGLQKALMFSYLFLALSPYVTLFYLISIAKERTAKITIGVTVFFIVTVGLYFILDNTYMERNLGDKFSFLFIPIWQLTMLLFLGLVIHLSNVPKKVT